MTITFLVGRQNEGKTLACTRLVLPDFLNGRTIYTNTPFAFPHTIINKDFLLYNVEKGVRLPNVSYVLDEFWLWADARKRDTLLSYFYLQSSKDNANIYLTAQTQRQMDIRLRENLHYLGECERRILWNRKFRKIPKEYRNMRKDLPQELQDRLFIILQLYEPQSLAQSIQAGFRMSDFILHSTKRIYAKPYFKLFDTERKIKLKL